MIKLSEAEKKRRKEKAIYDHSEHLLNIIWACRDEAVYNNHQWREKDQYTYMVAWNEYETGCTLSDGRKWYNRLENQWREYEKEHGNAVRQRVAIEF